MILCLIYMYIYVRRVYVPQFFVSSQQGFGVTHIKAPSACHSPRVLDRPCYSSQFQNKPCYSSQRKQCHSSASGLYLIQKITGKSMFEACRHVNPKTPMVRGRVREPFGSSFYMFYSPPWACPILFYLKSSLQSEDLPLTFLSVLFLWAFPFFVFQPPPF